MDDRPPVRREAATPSPRPVTIAMLTYRRPDDVAAAIPAVLAQAAEFDPPATVLIVDNDPDRGAETTVAGFAADGVRYESEVRPGIAAARNRALAAVPADHLLVFIDDDERPLPGWLRALVGTFAATSPAAVVGPVISEFESEPDAWLAAGRFFDRRRLPTGTRVDVAATNNLLLDMAQIRRHGVTFDEAFGISGGSDTLFSRQLTARGGEIVWCDEAIVTDQVPGARLTRRWVLNRAFRSGNSWVRTSVVIAPTRSGRLRARASGIVQGTARIAGGGLTALAGLLTRSLRRRARGTRTVYRGAGMIAGAAGYVFQEYRRGRPATAAPSELTATTVATVANTDTAP